LQIGRHQREAKRGRRKGGKKARVRTSRQAGKEQRKPEKFETRADWRQARKEDGRETAARKEGEQGRPHRQAGNLEGRQA
jgi:hypothetical protein